jgi:hypothetical protein
MFGYRPKHTALMWRLSLSRRPGAAAAEPALRWASPRPVMATRDLAAQIPLCIKTLLAGYTFHVCAD